MHPFPFTDAEWQTIAETCNLLVEASSENDKFLEAAQNAEIVALLDDLREKYGEHPVLIETEADFTSDPARSVSLYERAVELAQAHGLPTHSIRISLARTLLEEFNDAKRATSELNACFADVATYGDESDRREWTALLEQCKR